MSAWIKVFNSMPSHPKVLGAGERASWLFVCGLCYANEHLTDGFIARHVLAIAAPGVRSAERLANVLVENGLWRAVEGGWQIHGYTEHQESSDAIRERRSRDRDRKASTRSPQGIQADSAQNLRGVRGVRTEENRREQKRETTQVRDLFEFWCDRCDHGQAKLTTDRRQKIGARLHEGYTPEQIRTAIEGAAKGAFVNDQGKRFDDIELICRTGSKLESFIERANASVVPLAGRKESPSDLLRAINGGELA